MAMAMAMAVEGQNARHKRNTYLQQKVNETLLLPHKSAPPPLLLPTHDAKVSRHGGVPLSTEQELAFVHQHQQRMRMNRILQVRAQEMVFASQRVDEFRERKLEDKNKLLNHLKEVWRDEQRRQIASLAEEFVSSCQSIGLSYDAALLVECNRAAKEELLARQAEEGHCWDLLRSQEALQKARAEKESRERKQRAPEVRRKMVETVSNIERSLAHHYSTQCNKQKWQESTTGSSCHQTTNPPTASARDHVGNHNFIYSRPSGIPTDFKDTHLHSRFCVLRDCTNRSTSAHVAVNCRSDKELEVNAWRAADAQRKSNRCTKARQSEQEEINNERKLERGHAAAKLLKNGQRIASQLEQEVEEALQGGENLFRDQFHGLQALRQQQQGVQSCAGHDKCGISDKIIANTSSHDPLSCPDVTREEVHISSSSSSSLKKKAGEKNVVDNNGLEFQEVVVESQMGNTHTQQGDHQEMQQQLQYDFRRDESRKCVMTSVVGSGGGMMKVDGLFCPNSSSVVKADDMVFEPCSVSKSLPRSPATTAHAARSPRRASYDHHPTSQAMLTSHDDEIEEAASDHVAKKVTKVMPPHHQPHKANPRSHQLPEFESQRDLSARRPQSAKREISSQGISEGAAAAAACQQIHNSHGKLRGWSTPSRYCDHTGTTEDNGGIHVAGSELLPGVQQNVLNHTRRIAQFQNHHMKSDFGDQIVKTQSESRDSTTRCRPPFLSSGSNSQRRTRNCQQPSTGGNFPSSSESDIAAANAVRASVIASVKENIKDGVYNSQKLNLYSPPRDRSILQSTTRQATAAATFGCLRSTANRVKTIDNNNKSQKQNDTWQTHARSAASGGGPPGHSTSFKGQLQAVEAVYGRLRRANEWLHGKFGRKVDCAHGDQKLKVHAGHHRGHTRSARSWEEHHKDLHSAERSHGGKIIKPPKSQDPHSGYGCVPSQDQVDQSALQVLGGRIGMMEKVVIGKDRQELQRQKRIRELPKSTKHGRAVWKSYDERDAILRSRKDNNILLTQCCRTNTCRPCGGQSEPCSPTSHKLEADHFSPTRRRRRWCCHHHACRNEEDQEAADSSSPEHQCQLQPEEVVALQEHPQKLHVTQEKSCRTASIFRRSPAQRHTAPQICSSARTQHDVVCNGLNVTSLPHHNNMAPANVMLESTTNDDTRRRSGASGSFQSAEVFSRINKRKRSQSNCPLLDKTSLSPIHSPTTIERHDSAMRSSVEICHQPPSQACQIACIERRSSPVENTMGPRTLIRDKHHDKPSGLSKSPASRFKVDPPHDVKMSKYSSFQQKVMDQQQVSHKGMTIHSDSMVASKSLPSHDSRGAVSCKLLQTVVVPNATATRRSTTTVPHSSSPHNNNGHHSRTLTCTKSPKATTTHVVSPPQYHVKLGTRKSPQSARSMERNNHGVAAAASTTAAKVKPSCCPWEAQSLDVVLGSLSEQMRELDRRLHKVTTPSPPCTSRSSSPIEHHHRRGSSSLAAPSGGMWRSSCYQNCCQSSNIIAHLQDRIPVQSHFQARSSSSLASSVGSSPERIYDVSNHGSGSGSGQDTSRNTLGELVSSRCHEPVRYKSFGCNNNETTTEQQQPPVVGRRMYMDDLKTLLREICNDDASPSSRDLSKSPPCQAMKCNHQQTLQQESNCNVPDKVLHQQSSSTKRPREFMRARSSRPAAVKKENNNTKITKTGFQPQFLSSTSSGSLKDSSSLVMLSQQHSSSPGEDQLSGTTTSTTIPVSDMGWASHPVVPNNDSSNRSSERLEKMTEKHQPEEAQLQPAESPLWGQGRSPISPGDWRRLGLVTSAEADKQMLISMSIDFSPWNTDRLPDIDNNNNNNNNALETTTTTETAIAASELISMNQQQHSSPHDGKGD